MKKYYYVGVSNFNGSIFDNLDAALEEIKNLLLEESGNIIIRKTNLTQEQFEKLPDFEGY
jgi:hypothetical protein